MILRHRISFLLLTVCLLFLPSAAWADGIVSELTLELSTDKACYAPGSTVTFTAVGDLPAGKEVYVRYRHNNTFIHKEKVTSKTWTWTPPKTDYMGYMVDLYYMEWNGDVGTEHIIGAIAVDVSSDWKRFPRYGFVADFDDYKNTIYKDANIEAEMKYLNRLHINGVQFQDWQWKHHRPVKFENNNFVEWYQDISNRWIGTKYVKKYIDVQHRYGMKSIFYNLCFGAWKDYRNDGVSEDWGLYKKDSNGNLYQDYHGLPSNWQSDIFLMNPGNGEWQKYLKARNKEVYDNYGFDGYQIDQLGGRGNVFDKNGNKIDLQKTYGPFLEAMKGDRTDKRLVMNCIDGFGTHHICDAKLDDGTRAVDFCYNEVWGGQASFSDLFQIIKDNDRESDHSLQTVFAAYINYNKADHAWDYNDKNVNTPGALLTDAVMFAIGGSHLEMGDHMLTREYFPAKPLAMTDELKQRLIHYYDFQTAYQNLLRGIDSKAAFTPTISSSTHAINAWPPLAHRITAFAKKVDNMIAVHLLNFLNTDDLSWRDLEGTRPAPEKQTNVQITYTTSRHITKVWTATPDMNGGVPMELSFTQTGNDVSVTVPSLEYWTMLVFEGTDEEENMYIIGDATQAEWDLAKAQPMIKSADGKTFGMTVHLEAGKQFKFVNGKDYNTNYSYYAEYKNFEFKSGYNSANLLVSKSTVAYSDYKFTVSETGDYYITLDLNNMRIYVNKAAKLYDKLYVIGSATQAEWDLTKAIPLTKSENGFEYSGTCLIISDGTKEFKFMTDNTADKWNQDQFVKGATENDIVKYDGNIEHDYKWVFSKEQSGNYKITVNLNTMRVTFTKLESKVYLCDGAFGVGSWENYTTEMKRKVADDVFTYTFKTGNWNETEKKEYKYLRFKIVNGDFSDIYAPSGDNNVSLTAGTFATVPVDNSTTPNPSAGDEARSWSFETKPNTTYTIMVKNVNSGGYYHDKGLAIAYFEEPTYDKAASGGNPQLVVPENSLDGTKFVQCGGAYWYLDVDLTANNGDFKFKFYSPTDKEYIGAYNHEMNTVNTLSFTNFYWGNNELGPETYDLYGRNLLYTLKAKGKVRINLWKVGKDSNTGETTWKFYIANHENLDNITYNMVLNGKRYAMSPTRERIGNRNVLRTVWSLNLQDFQLKGINNGEFGYYIESSDGKKYSCHSINAGYPLGLKTELPDYYPNGTSHKEGGAFEDNYSKDAGNVARYERYDDMQVNGDAEFHFSSSAMEHYNGKSVTWIFNPGRGYTLTALINKSNFGGEEATSGYSLVGNLNADDKDSSDPFSIHMQLPAYQRKLTKYWYKGGRLYDTEQAAADSIVYRVTVNRPANGWKSGGYVMVVFDNATLQSAAMSSANFSALWQNAIRPQEEWLHPYSGSNQSDYTGVDATALKGGLYTRRRDESGNIIQKDDVQQMISFTPQGESFTFSVNATTSTYSITDNDALFIMGPAVGKVDADRETAGWNSDQPDTQTAHAYRLTYDSSLGCYCYKGADGNGDEQPVPMAAGRLFAFAYNKQFNNLFFSEDGDVPRALIDAEGNSTEATAYAAETGTNGKYDTQYVNWLQPHDFGADTYDASVVNACRFSLPTNTDGGYYIRLYTKPGDTDTSLPKSAYYTIRRAYTFSTPVDPKNSVGTYNTFKTFSDYHAVVIPTGIDALYVSSANKATRTLTATKYPLCEKDGKRVLPAGAAVILVESKEVTGTSGTIVKSTESLDYYSDPTFAEASYGSKPADNMLKPQITRTKLPYKTADGNYYNYLFAYQKRWDSDQKKTIGFFEAGAANNPVNTAYLQIDKSFNDAAAKGWSLSFDFNDATGIRQPEIVDGSGDYYTLQGIRIKKPATKGVYIVNGKKVIR